jgi:hypothetical protein
MDGDRENGIVRCPDPVVEAIDPLFSQYVVAARRWNGSGPVPSNYHNGVLIAALMEAAMNMGSVCPLHHFFVDRSLFHVD